MKRLSSVSITLFIALCLFFASEHPAWGYVDPGSGFLALQSIASVLAAAGFFLRRHIKSFFSRNPDKKAALAPKEESPANLA